MKRYPKQNGNILLIVAILSGLLLSSLLYSLFIRDFTKTRASDEFPIEIANLTATETNVKIAFIGDQGLTVGGKAVLKLIQDESAAAVAHIGDFEYTNNPEAFDQQINDAWPTNQLPYFGTIGNHDTANWTSPNGGYKAILEVYVSFWQVWRSQTSRISYIDSGSRLLSGPE